MSKRSHAHIILTIVVVALFYGAWLVAQRPFDNPAALAQIGASFLDQGSGTSTRIDELNVVASRGTGYDGQFFLFMALDLSRAPSYLDNPRYRMGRVGFPLTATIIAGGQRSAIPWTMLGIELFAVLVTTGLLAATVTTLGGSAFLALIYGLSPGLFLSASRFLAEAPANAFAALGMYLWIRARESRRRHAAIMGIGSAFAAAALIRETTLLFPLGIAVWSISAGEGQLMSRIRSALALVGLSAAPLLCWQAFLGAWLPPEPLPDAAKFPFFPFGGLVEQGATIGTPAQIIVVVAPCCLAATIIAIGTRWSVWTAVVALNAIVLVVFLPTFSYDDFLASGRISLAVVLAFVLAIPAIRGRLAVYGVAVATILWMLPWVYFFPRNVL